MPHSTIHRETDAKTNRSKDSLEELYGDGYTDTQHCAGIQYVKVRKDHERREQTKVREKGGHEDVGGASTR